MNSHEVFIHIHQGCFAGTGAIVRLPQCQWSKLDGYGKISQCITTIKHSKAKTECIFLGIYSDYDTSMDCRAFITLFINSLWANHVIWWHRSGSILVEVMACCLMAPSYYLNQCRLLIRKVQWYPPESNFTFIAQAYTLYNEFENDNSKLLPHLPGAMSYSTILKWLCTCKGELYLRLSRHLISARFLKTSSIN